MSVDNGAPPAEHVFVTPGSCQALAAVLQSVAFDGGVALLPEIHWPIHLQQVLLAGLRPRFFREADPAAAAGKGVAASAPPNAAPTAAPVPAGV